MRWKALAEIYKMHSFAPLSKLNFLLKIAKEVANFSENLTKFVKKFARKFVDFRADFLWCFVRIGFRRDGS